jgi:DNA helicase-2/ATP-dependent DNA helicase PcrA
VQAAHRDPDAELAALVSWIRARTWEGIAPAEIAVLVRLNAQLEPVEVALTRAGIAHQVRGQGFWQRSEVRSAVMALRRKPAPEAVGPALAAVARARWASSVGYLADADAVETLEGDEAQERQASLEILAGIMDDLVRADPGLDVGRLLAELDARADHERHGAADGVNLLTIHRAKGLEWDAVALPQVEEGYLPVRQAKTDDAVAEERRLFYVGLTRARTHLLVSWTKGRKQSRFVDDLRPPRPMPGTTVTLLGGPPPQVRPQRRSDTGDPVFDALRAWRTEQAQAEGTQPYLVAHDATLTAIAETRPRTTAGLRRVKGMGPAKIEQYGDAILAVVAQALAPDA